MSENNIDYKKIETLQELVNSLKSTPVITVRDMVLMLLYAQDKPIYGRILLFKEVFLLYMEILKKWENKIKIQDPNFVPYYYGPYSFDLAEILEQLEWLGYIKREGRKNSTVEKFELTEKGKKEIEELFENLPEELKEEIKRRRKGWDQLGTSGILKYVYQNYESYKEKSKIKDKYKNIIWGHGIG